MRTFELAYHAIHHQTAALPWPVAWYVGNLGADDGRGVQLLIGELPSRGCVDAAVHARADDLDGGAHVADARSHVLRCDRRSRKTQRYLGLDDDDALTQARPRRAALQDARQGGCREHVASAGFPGIRPPVYEPAQCGGHAILNRVRLGFRWWLREIGAIRRAGAR